MVLPVNPMNLGRMEKRMALQQELMAALSHEIRTPVARLSFALQLLQDILEGDSVSEQQQRMKSSCKGMAQDLEEINDLVAEIMTYIHLEDGGPRIIFQKVDVNHILTNMCGQYAPQNPQLSIKVDPLLDGLIIDAEPVQLRRACQNLLGNACKYAQAKVSLGYHIEGDFCVLRIEDFKHQSCRTIGQWPIYNIRVPRYPAYICCTPVYVTFLVIKSILMCHRRIY